METHSVIIPTYNERDNIGPLVQGILDLCLSSRIVIVDDSSPDGTGDLADALAQRHPNVCVIHRPGKLGLGTAHITGMAHALAQGVGAILTMDADFSHHPRHIPELLAALQRFDLVIGSRYVPGGGTRYCTAARRALSRGANLVARSLLSLQASDATAGFRAYRRAVLESIPLEGILSDGYSFLIELLFLCQAHGWSIGEIPIVFENRQHGSSKISKAEIVKAMHTVLRLSRSRLGSSYRPAAGTARGRR